jgi:hypothetical protein
MLDRLEAHVLRRRFRYDHAHAAGDVTIWHNYMTMHNAPPSRQGARNRGDARLMYRVSCKGPPALTLPRADHPAWLAAHVATGYTTGHGVLARGS